MNTGNTVHTARQKQHWQWQVDNNLNAYAETDFEKKTVRVNRKRHASKRTPRISRKPDGTEHLGKSLYHESLHIAHPKMHEKIVRKMEKQFDLLPKKSKKKLYSKLK